jgi:hypothetical protein
MTASLPFSTALLAPRATQVRRQQAHSMAAARRHSRGKPGKNWRENWREASAAALVSTLRRVLLQHSNSSGFGSTKLLDVHPRDRTRDHHLLDLGGALEDVVDQPVIALQSRSGLPTRNRPRQNPVESGRIGTRLARSIRGGMSLAPTRPHAGTPDAVVAPQRIIRPVAQLGPRAPTQAAGRAPAPATPTQGSTDRGPSA